MAAARRFFEKAMREHGAPQRIAMDKSGANKAAIDESNDAMAVLITARQVKYLNNIVEQDHRAIKRVTRPMLGCTPFRSAGYVLAGIELMHMIRKGQFVIVGAASMSFADQFYALAGQCRPA
jgi:transposase-like protein